jgi:hypothetical protein
MVLGAWPEEPSTVETTNREYLTALPEGLLGAIPRGAPSRGPETFRREAPVWLAGAAQRMGTP